MNAKGKLLDWLDATAAGYRGWSRRRKATAELNRLDDRMLSDIGISRSEIPAVVNGLGRNLRRRPANCNAAPVFGRRKAA